MKFSSEVFDYYQQKRKNLNDIDYIFWWYGTISTLLAPFVADEAAYFKKERLNVE